MLPAFYQFYVLQIILTGFQDVSSKRRSVAACYIPSTSLIKLAEFYKTSIDYLVGLTNNKNIYAIIIPIKLKSLS